jgi:phosphoglycerate dehydrogenase-like enzyme
MNAKSGVATGTDANRPLRIVAALRDEERKLFLAGIAAEFEQLPAEFRWLDESELKADGWAERLRALSPDVLVTAWQVPPLPETWIEAPDCPLQYVCHITGSVRRLVPRSFLVKGGRVTNWGSLAAAPVAEHALLLGLAGLRNLAAWRPFMNRAPTDRSIEKLGTRSLFGRRVGLHGFGAIARELVSLLTPFRTTIAAYSAGVPASAMRDLGVEPCASLHELFARSDVLFGCEALTPENEGAVTASVLAALPDGAVFVNVGRGRIANEDAVLREARLGRIRVAIDVVTHEPISPDSPWLEVDGVLVSPHIGGPTLDLYPNFGRHALDNIRRFLNRRPLVGAVTLATYDRST